MAESKERMEEVGRAIAGLWEDRDLDAIRPLYRDDSLFISPNPPFISPEFRTTLEGRDEILRFFGVCLEMIDSNPVSTIALLTGVDIVVWTYRVDDERMAAEVIQFGADGLIDTHRVTAIADL